MKNASRIFSVLVLALIVGVGVSWNDNVANAGAGQRAGANSNPISPGTYRIAVVNRKQVFDEYNKQKSEWTSLEKEREQKQAVVDRQSDAIEADKKKLAEDKSLTQAQKEALALKIQEDTLDYQNAFQKLQNEINMRADKFFAAMMRDVDAAVQEIGSEGNYHLIFEADPNPRSGSAVLYFSATIDITSQVVEKLNSGR